MNKKLNNGESFQSLRRKQISQISTSKEMRETTNVRDVLPKRSDEHSVFDKTNEARDKFPVRENV